jgi:hypothetical protein
LPAIPTYPLYDVKMTRYVLLLLIAASALLDGCNSNHPEPPPVYAQSPRSDDEHCHSVARERADDALANGYDFNIAGRVYQETYDDCVAWRPHNKPE